MKEKRKSSISPNHYLFFLIFSAAFFLYLLLQGSTLPFVGYNAWNYNTYSLIAHNYNSFGYFATKFAPIISVSQTLPYSPEYYFNHPPLLSILQSFFFRVLGESFFTGRLVNILASFFSLILLSLLASKLVDRRFAFIVFIVGVLIPASSIFGKMIGQESLVLFFALSIVYSSLLYEETRKKRYLFLATLVSALGVLSDWPAVYFAAFFSVYLLSRRQYLLVGIVLGTTVATAILYLFYVSAITHDLTFLLQGFLNRSVGQLLKNSQWFLSWVTTIAARLVFYFNIFFVFLSGFYVILSLKKKVKQDRLQSIIFVLLMFGLAHILLYPEGSFGHPYWMYYLLPFVTLSSSFILYQLLLRKKVVLLLLLFLFSLMYVLLLTEWKTREVKGNLFRYQLAEIASDVLPLYRAVAVNSDGVIDPEIFQFAFKIPTVKLDSNTPPYVSTPFTKVIYTCFGVCSQTSKQFSYLNSTFQSQQFVGDGVEMWIFTLNMLKRNNIPQEKKTIPVKVPRSNHTLFKNIYLLFLRHSSAPQL